MKHDVLSALAMACASLIAPIAAIAAPDTFTATRVDGPSMTGQPGSLSDNGVVVARAAGVYWYTGPNGVGYSLTPPLLVGQQLVYIAAVNASGQVLGSWIPPGKHYPHGFLTSADGSTLEDIPPPAGDRIEPQAVDNQGRVAGDMAHQAFRTDRAGDLQPLGIFGPGYVSAYAIRNGVTVGTHSELVDGNFITHGFRTGTDGRALVDLGELVEGGQSWAAAINASGRIVGYAGNSSGESTAVVTKADGSGWQAIDDSAMFYNSYATGIDNAGHVVGDGYPSVSHNGVVYPVPFITGANAHTVHNLNDLVVLPIDGRVGQVVAINERGQILVTDSHWSNTGIWLLTPTRATWAQEIEAP